MEKRASSGSGRKCGRPRRAGSGLWACSGRRGGQLPRCTAPPRPAPAVYSRRVAGRPPATVARVTRRTTHACVRYPLAPVGRAVHSAPDIAKKITNPNFPPNRSRVVCRVKCERGADERCRGKCISRWCKAQAVRAGGGACDDGHRIDFYLPAPPLLWWCRARHRSLHRPLN